jgi:beta-1,4-mannosyl-glycoprotein beta-1,4-N-acetylglucosaminyltransferase
MKPKIYICFPYLNETSILLLKMEELYDIVDYFVIVEANSVHSGGFKPWNLEKNLELTGNFDRYASKILYQQEVNLPANLVDLKPDSKNDPVTNFLIERCTKADWYDRSVPSYCADSWQKESVIRSLTNCQPYDRILLGDCDEIPKASVVKELSDNFDVNQVYHLQHSFWWYYTNIQKTDEKWYGNIMVSFEHFKQQSFCEMRTYKKGIFVPDAGWHFSYMGGADNVKTKIRSWGEQSLNKDYVRNNIEKNIDECLISGHDLFYRPATFKKVDISYETHPKYLVENQDRFRSYIK